MYLSRVEINPRLRACKQALNSPQRLHAIIAASFPAPLGDEVMRESAQRHLWRLDKLDHSLYVLVASPGKPDFSHLIEQIGWPAAGQKWETAFYDTFLAHLKPGQQWQFRLCANPTCSKKDVESPRMRGKVIPCLKIDEQKKWLEIKMSKHGASLNGFELTSRGVSRFDRDGKTITLNVATFEGILTVTDPDLLREALTNGIGRAKAYGCGLLTLAQVPR